MSLALHHLQFHAQINYVKEDQTGIMSTIYTDKNDQITSYNVLVDQLTVKPAFHSP